MSLQIDMLPEVKRDPKEDPDKRYTLATTMDWVRIIAGVDAFDLDVAADDESHWALGWYSVKENGLAQTWQVPRVFCNPPFSDLEPWLAKAWDEWEARAQRGPLEQRLEVIAMLLPGDRTEQPFWQRHIEPYRDGRNPVLRTFFPATRIRYGMPGNREGHSAGSPTFTTVLLVWRDWP